MDKLNDAMGLQLRIELWTGYGARAYQACLCL